MNQKKRNVDFRWWAIAGVIVPVVAILAFRFCVAPLFWPHFADALGSVLGYFFIWYLLGLVIVATVWKIVSERGSSA